MTRDQRLFMVAAGEAGPWDALRTNLESVLSQKTRARCRQYAAVRGMLGAALAEPDDRVTLRIKRWRRPDPKLVASSALLGVLSLALVLEWGTYTFPAIKQYMSYVAHRCGLR